MFSAISQYTSIVREFCWKHRGKIVIGASVAVGVALTYSYSGYILDEDQDEDGQIVSSKVSLKSIDSKKKNDVLRRIRKENDATMKYFLTTLRTKLNEVIDVASLTRQIRALRENPTGDTSSIETELWENLKVSSFSSVFVAIYLLSAVTVLVLVQRHILATRLPSLNSSASASNNKDRMNSNIAIDSDDILDLFPTIITKSYDHLFNRGIQNFSENVRNIVQMNLKDWSAGNKLEVDFHDLVLMILSIRRNIDNDLQSTIRTLIIPEDTHHEVASTEEAESTAVKSPNASAIAELEGNATASSTIRKDPHEMAAVEDSKPTDAAVGVSATVSSSSCVAPAEGREAAAVSTAAGVQALGAEQRSDPTDALLNQVSASIVAHCIPLLHSYTWDVVELPLFRAALKEALDRCFENFFVELRRSVFAPGNPTGHAPLRKPPLASLLPPLKTIATRLLDGNSKSCSAPVSSSGIPAATAQSVDRTARAVNFPVWQDVANGVLLDELCVGVFDSLCTP